MKELICIICPKGCRLRADEELNITGHGCERGLAYARKEFVNPTRVLTTTVCIDGGTLPRLPVKTDRDIPKARIHEAMRQINLVRVKAPVSRGDVVLENLCGMGVNVIATRSMQ